MLVFSYVRQDTGSFAGLGKTPQSLLKALIVPDFDNGHLISNPLSLLPLNVIFSVFIFFLNIHNIISYYSCQVKSL